MNRLTIDYLFCDVAVCITPDACKDRPDGCDQRKIYEKLREYEKIGLEPGEVIELKKQLDVTKQQLMLTMRERDAAVMTLADQGHCEDCLHGIGGGDLACYTCAEVGKSETSNWQWRGLCESNERT